MFGISYFMIVNLPDHHYGKDSVMRRTQCKPQRFLREHGVSPSPYLVDGSPLCTPDALPTISCERHGRRIDKSERDCGQTCR
jgi:hypothetical protein